jgi:hypothetical protein
MNAEAGFRVNTSAAHTPDELPVAVYAVVLPADATAAYPAEAITGLVPMVMLVNDPDSLASPASGYAAPTAISLFTAVVPVVPDVTDVPDVALFGDVWSTGLLVATPENSSRIRPAPLIHVALLTVAAMAVCPPAQAGSTHAPMYWVSEEANPDWTATACAKLPAAPPSVTADVEIDTFDPEYV